MLASTTAAPLLPNLCWICSRTLAMSAARSPPATRSTWAATAPMNAMPIMRVCRLGSGACRLATANASMTRKVMPRARMVRRAVVGRSRQACSGVPLDWRMNVPPSTRPLSGSVWLNTLWSGLITTSTSSSSALVTSTGSGLRVM